MKIKDILLIGSILLSFNSYAQEVLFSVGNNEVTAEEFKAVYEKNKDVVHSLTLKHHRSISTCMLISN